MREELEYNPEKWFFDSEHKHEILKATHRPQRREHGLSKYDIISFDSFFEYLIVLTLDDLGDGETTNKIPLELKTMSKEDFLLALQRVRQKLNEYELLEEKLDELMGKGSVHDMLSTEKKKEEAKLDMVLDFFCFILPNLAFSPNEYVMSKTSRHDYPLAGESDNLYRGSHLLTVLNSGLDRFIERLMDKDATVSYPHWSGSLSSWISHVKNLKLIFNKLSPGNHGTLTDNDVEEVRRCWPSLWI